ncbi:hypothetical protein N7470_001062 [Penicillium chermesinum]|nr:hypothetical protein N7470_001062 [Penicillium chermesinum]
MFQVQTAPYGRWESPLTAERMATENIALYETAVDEPTGAIYSVELHPTEDGRHAIMQHLNGEVRDILPNEFSAAGTVQELGGGSIELRRDGKIIFVDEDTCNVHLLDPTTSETELVRKAEEGEDHREATPETQATDVHNTLVAFNAESGQETTIAQGDDFYSHPRFDPSGKFVSWIQWSHPDMPWTGTILHYAEWDNGSLANDRAIAGKAEEESIAQPRWGLDGQLYFASDCTGFWQLYSFNPTEQNITRLPLGQFKQSGFAVAEWELGRHTYIFLDETTIVAHVITRATGQLVLIDTASMSIRQLDLPYVSVYELRRVSPDSFSVVGASTTFPEELAVIKITPSSDVTRRVLRSTASNPLESNYISIAKEMTAPQKYGPLTDGQVHMFYYEPRNPRYRGETDTRPPCLVSVHGGPNSNVDPGLNLEIQYWTTRGYAVCDVNYTGSTGYGREYRERLSGYWGLVDVGDAVSAVDFLGNDGLIDKAKVGIFGGSAGGYLALRALHMYPEIWAAGVSSYGISDVRALQADSYKFESQDVDRLLLSKTEPKEREQELTNRSSPAVAGTEDVCVPVAQARMMADAMKTHGRVAEVIEFEGEGHGWEGEDAILESFVRTEEWWKRHLT